jgi:hypothetical protein
MLPISYSTGKAKSSIFGVKKSINEFYGLETKGKPLGIKGLLRGVPPVLKAGSCCCKTEIA